MKQYFLSPMEQIPGPMGLTWVPRAANAARFPGLTAVSVFTASDPATGAPNPPWALVIVSAQDITPLLADTALGVLFDHSLLDVLLGAVSPTAVTAAAAALKAGPWGATLGPLVKALGTDPVRSVITQVGKQIAPGFDSYAFDCLGG